MKYGTLFIAWPRSHGAKTLPKSEEINKLTE